MLKVLFGSSTGILSIITVVGAITVVVGWAIYWYTKFGKDK
jgi:predicted PurR-regulated permease PerM